MFEFDITLYDADERVIYKHGIVAAETYADAVANLEEHYAPDGNLLTIAAINNIAMISEDPVAEDKEILNAMFSQTRVRD